MGWHDYYRLLELYDGDLSRAGKEELEAAAETNRRDPDRDRRIAEKVYWEKTRHAGRS
jgi:hypothetical protein